MTTARTFYLGCGALALAVLFCAVRSNYQVAPPATPPNLAAPAADRALPRQRPTDPAPFAAEPAIEAVAGGKLQNGQWHFGYVPDRAGTKKFLGTLPKPTLTEAGPELLKRASANQPVLLYRALNESFAAFNGGRPWIVGKQGIGDCVSWGAGHACDVCLAVEYKLGQTSEWRSAATEAIYGGSRVEARGVSRGGYSDGSYGGAAAKFVHDWGVLLRQPYPELGFDLTTYSSKRAKDWGNFGCGGSGDNGKADTVAKQHPVKSVALVRTFEEAAAAIAAGYPVAVCSGQGFASQRDKEGFAAARGSWAHCMCFIGVRFDRPGLLCLNSWGPDWISGPKWPADQPDGSFWVAKTTAERMLAGEDSFAYSAYEGFPWRDLRHGDWVQLSPPHRQPVRPGNLGNSERATAGKSTHPADNLALSLAL